MDAQPMASRPAPDTLRFERRIAHPPQRLWAAITEPEWLDRWLTESGSIELRVGGAVTFAWSDDGRAEGEVTRLETGRLIEYSWREQGHAVDSLVTFELEPLGDGGTLLRLTHRRIEQVAGFGAGWHAHLDMLIGALDGDEVRWQDRWDELKPRYEEAMAT